MLNELPPGFLCRRCSNCASYGVPQVFSRDRFAELNIITMRFVLWPRRKQLRPDDTPETLAHRLGVYYKNTAPLLGFYRAQGKLKTLDGMAPIAQVTSQIYEALEGLEAKA